MLEDRAVLHSITSPFIWGMVMGFNEALQLAAQAWQDKDTGGKVMDPELAKAFATILMRETKKSKEAGVGDTSASISCPDCGALLQVELKFVRHR